MDLLSLACCLAYVAPMPADEVLCDRAPVAPVSGPARSFPNRERIAEEGKGRTSRVYALSSVTVTHAGWEIHAVSIYTATSRPANWQTLRRARLNVVPKQGDVPDADLDPRKGKEVEVAVSRVREGVYLVRAANLNLSLKPGEYWIGLTPLVKSAVTGDGLHLVVHAPADARFEDVARAPAIDDQPLMQKWITVGPGIYGPLGEHLSIRIEGRTVPHGRLSVRAAEGKEGDKQLHLRFATFDPLAKLPKVPKELEAPAVGRLWIVQARRVVDRPFRDQLTEAGASLLHYLPDDAYIVRLNADRVKQVRNLAGVRWVGPYHPAYRVDPNVSPDPLARPSFGDTMPKKEPKGTRQVLISLFSRDAAKKEVAKVVRDAGGIVVYASSAGTYLAADVPTDKLAAVANSDAVCAIERRFEGFEEHQAPSKDGKGMITLAEIRELCGAEAIRKSGGYEGLGVRVGFWDDHVRADHIDLIARPLSIVGPPLRTNANHGTAIASILCGEGRGDARARGLLPLGGLVFAADRVEPAHEDRHALVERFTKDHRAAVVSSSSSNWGGLPFVKHYDAGSFLLDDLVQRYDLLMCQAIGNSTGAGNGLAGSWAKNALLVGGIAPRGSLRRADHRHGTYTSGPAADGRIKPDLAHFGAGVFTATASSPRAYSLFGGTSCATPLTAGLCGLMTEMWADGALGTLPLGKTVYERRPHAATAKALMINSAYRYPIEGKEPIFTRFRQGWGMADVGRLWESRKSLFVIDQETALRDHEVIEYRLRVAEQTPELRVTLAWTDLPGATSAARALVNDLDLVVIDPDGKRYLGNHGLIEGNASLPGGSADRVNNVENVFLDAPKPGVWRVQVAAHRIAWHRGNERGQDFGLVVAGVRPEPAGR